MLPAAGAFCVSLGAHRAAVRPLSGIGKPGSGCTADFTSDGQEPLNRGLSHYELNNSGVIAFFYGIET